MCITVVTLRIDFITTFQAAVHRDTRGTRASSINVDDRVSDNAATRTEVCRPTNPQADQWTVRITWYNGHGGTQGIGLPAHPTTEGT